MFINLYTPVYIVKGAHEGAQNTLRPVLRSRKSRRLAQNSWHCRGGNKGALLFHISQQHACYNILWGWLHWSGLHVICRINGLLHFTVLERSRHSVLGERLDPRRRPFVSLFPPRLRIFRVELLVSSRLHLDVPISSAQRVEQAVPWIRRRHRGPPTQVERGEG